MDLRPIFHGLLATTLAACGGAIVTPDDGGTTPNEDHFVPKPPGSKCTSEIPASKQSCGWSVKLQGDCSGLADPVPEATCMELCGFNEKNCWLPGWGGPGTLSCGLACEGRRPAGLRERRTHAMSAAGEWFARAAWLEAASIDAFAILHDELAHHGAPAELLEATLESAKDEIAHARIMRSLARGCGAEPETPSIERGPIRDLEAIALENAVEGCVRETYGALQNAWQAERAASARVRAAMRVIAKDEMKHASLAWQIAAWIEPKLDREARARVEKARSEAAEELARIQMDDSLADACGLPTTAQATMLVLGLRAHLWS